MKWGSYNEIHNTSLRTFTHALIWLEEEVDREIKASKNTSKQ